LTKKTNYLAIKIFVFIGNQTKAFHLAISEPILLSKAHISIYIYKNVERIESECRGPKYQNKENALDSLVLEQGK